MTSRRIRVYPWLIAATMWSVVAIDFSAPGVRDRIGKVKGTDFLQFYVAGSRVRQGRTDLLYDFTAQYEGMQSVAGGDDNVYLPIQSPQAALAFSPLAAYPYTTALAIWVAVSVLAYALACWLAWRHSPGLRGHAVETVGCCAAFPGLYATVLHGQVSAVAALLVVVALLALRGGRPWWAGFAFGALAFKPHWAAAAAAVFLVAREWRVVAGIAAGALLQVGITGLVLGWDVVSAYAGVLASLQQHGELLEPRPGHTLRGFFAALLPWPRAALVPYVIAAAVAVLGAALVWRRHPDADLRCAGVVLAMILISPHAFEYDLVMLVPVFFVLANWIRTSAAAGDGRVVSRLLVVLFFSPVLAVLPAVIRLQCSVTIMAALLALITLRGGGGREGSLGDRLDRWVLAIGRGRVGRRYRSAGAG